MINRDRTDLSLTKKSKLLKISRSSLYYTPVGVNAETQKLMHEIDRMFKPNMTDVVSTQTDESSHSLRLVPRFPMRTKRAFAAAGPMAAHSKFGHGCSFLLLWL
ncbi:hypothetical protein Z949_1943 [Sulfitobacter guttiformis KCTC 32187]|nr:hypothetical protein Z949_1943 [Sulfitobacter guttiformis KCTC 32187]